jgi:hypothetical protein
MSELLDAESAARFSGLALSHVTREHPNKLDHVLTGPKDVLGVRALHPVFYGSFDWHSCVHGYWLLARLMRRFPGHGRAEEARALFDGHLVPERVRGELDYLARPASGGFERPYGWAWLLMLSSELARSGPPAAPWATAVRPLGEAFADRFKAFLPKATYPVRTGVHSSTAFALRLALEYGRTVGDEDLVRLIRSKALEWHLKDRDARPFEPSGDDFLSPTLMEAELMRAVLDEDAFQPWLAAFLPSLAAGEPSSLFEPARVSDRSDGKIAHLDGLNLSRAWCLRSLARGAPSLKPGLEAAADRHLAAGLDHVAGDYMGEHWLASFAVLALDGL